MIPFDLQAQIPGEDSVSLAERYRTVRFRALVQEYLSGQRMLPIRPVQSLPTRVDSLVVSSSKDRSLHQAREERGRSRPSFQIDAVRRVRDLERSWFRDQYGDVEWSFLGPGRRLTFADTVRTRDLRARLQAKFGNPTRTLAEIYSNEWARTPDSVRTEAIQFEYWFVVNDSIPVRVSDVDGPRGRGGIISTDRRWREQLPELRSSLLQPLRQEGRAPYADYYYEPATGRWYRVGFDGTSFFRERISRFDIVPGRRPTPDTTTTDSSTVPRTEAPPPSDP